MRLQVWSKKTWKFSQGYKVIDLSGPVACSLHMLWDNQNG